MAATTARLTDLRHFMKQKDVDIYGAPLDDWLADLQSFRPRMRISQSMCVPRTNAVNSSLVRECSAAEADAGKGSRGVLGRLSLRRTRLLSSPMDGTLIKRRSNWMRTGN